MDGELQAARERVRELTVAVSVRSVPRVLTPLLQTTLTIQQLKALTTIAVSDGATTTDLVDQFAVSMATMSKLIDRLVSNGLVERRPDADDQRVRRLHPTAAGRTVVANVLGRRPELGDDVLRGLSLDELRGLEVGLGAINRELRRLAGASDQAGCDSER